MKSSKSVGMILASLTLALAGCEAPKGTIEPSPTDGHSTKAEGHAGPSSLSSPVPPIEPSTLPEMPSTARGDMAKKEEARRAEKKAEEPAKAEAPK